MKNVKIVQAIKYLTLICVVGVFMLSNTVRASNNKESQEQAAHEEQFNAGEMILDHIVNHNSWHIMDLNGHPITINLPVILRYNGKWDVFMSSRFNRGHSSYKGYKIADAGNYEGKIVHVTHKNGERQYERPLDLSITKDVAALFTSAIILLIIFLSVAKRYKQKPRSTPKGLQSLLEPLIIFIRDEVAKPAIGKEKYHKYMPYLLTLFFFILLNNLLGLVPIPPGGANLTGNLAITGIMAAFTFAITLGSSNKYYWKNILNPPGVPWWLKIPIPIIPIVEFTGIFTKPFTLMIRLFANMAGGHIVLLSFISLIFIFAKNFVPIAGLAVSPISLAFSIFVSLLELLVAFIQAYVFVLLSALYFGMAMEEEH